MTTYTPEQLRSLISPLSRDVIATINRWLDRGDGVAVYRNVELGHPDLGHRQFVSYGSSSAQLEVDSYNNELGGEVRHEGVPPQRLPDIGSRINWRYQLEGIYRGEAL